MADVLRSPLYYGVQQKRPIAPSEQFARPLTLDYVAPPTLDLPLIAARLFESAPRRKRWQPDYVQPQGFIIEEVPNPEIVSLFDSAPSRISRLSLYQPPDLLGTTLAQFVLQVQDSAHSHTAGNVTLLVGVTLAVADTEHGHTADNIDLVQANVLAIADALHEHAADNTALTQAHVLVVSESSHGHAVDSLTLSTGLQLELQDALHAHLADQPSLTQAHVLVVSDALHAHLADLVSIFDPASLVVNDALHAHLCDALGIARVSDATRRVIVVAVNRTVRVH